MPRRRPVDKGSFGGHFDELVKFFPAGRTPAWRVQAASKPKRKAKSAAAINRFLFDHAAH